MPDIDELIADDQAVSAAAYDELEDNNYMMMMQDTGENARERDDDDDMDGQSGGRGDAGNGRGGREMAGDGDGAGEGERPWQEMMGGCSDEGAGSGGTGSSGINADAEVQVGVGGARERVGPGKWRRVATLARWEPSARARMLSQLEDATVDVTGD